MRLHFGWSVVLVCSAALGDGGKPGEDKSKEGTFGSAFGVLTEVTGEVRGLDWESEFAGIDQWMRSMFEENGWDTESDRAAMDMALEVTAIPPWAFMDRMDKFAELTAKRYGLDERGRMRVKGIVMRETGVLAVKHADTMLTGIRLAMSRRAEGHPLDAQLVAEWAQMVQPIMADVEESLRRSAEELRPLMTPANQRKLQRDLDADERRYGTFSKDLERWSKGEWKPEDWSKYITGQRRAVREAMGVSVQAVRWVSHDPSTWWAFVLACRDKFGFDAAQLDAARSIHTELSTRAADLLRARADELKAVPHAQRGTHEAYASIRGIFDSLRERVEALATSSQRERVDK